MTALAIVEAVAIVALLFVLRRRRAHSVSAASWEQINFLFLMEEDPAIRSGLRVALDVIEADRGEVSVNACGAMIAELARHSFNAGDPRSGMLEAFAAACSVPDRFGEIEVTVSAILAGDEGVDFRRGKIAPITGRESR